MNKYDVVIIGAGPAGEFCAYELTRNNPNAKVLVVEEGSAIGERVCPLASGKVDKCVKCPVCAITHGSAGAGAFSDGKLNLPHSNERRVRGNLGRHLSVTEASELFQYTDEIYLKFGANPKIEGLNGPDYINNELKRFLDEAGLQAICSRIRHLGTDGARLVYENIESELRKSVEFMFNTTCLDIIVQDDTIQGVIVQNGNQKKKIFAPKVVLAIGRSGSNWMEGLCNKHNIKYSFGVADIGIRYELPDKVMESINQNLYEGKIFGISKYGDKVRTFCQNPSGLVSTESYDGTLTLVNGHANLDASSENTNLALLVSVRAGNTNALAHNIGMAVNQLGNGPVIQRFGDFKMSRSTKLDALENNPVRPTLEVAIPNDISLAMPKRIMEALIEFIEKMDIVAPGFADPYNLVYAPEIKFYSLALTLTKDCETSISGLYGIGDGSGPTHGLMPASVNGVALGRYLAKNI